MEGGEGEHGPQRGAPDGAVARAAAKLHGAVPADHRQKKYQLRRWGGRGGWGSVWVRGHAGWG